MLHNEFSISRSLTETKLMHVYVAWRYAILYENMKNRMLHNNVNNNNKKASVKHRH